jgi:hypothetical protein
MTAAQAFELNNFCVTAFTAALKKTITLRPRPFGQCDKPPIPLPNNFIGRNTSNGSGELTLSTAAAPSFSLDQIVGKQHGAAATHTDGVNTPWSNRMFRKNRPKTELLPYNHRGWTGHRILSWPE